MQDTLINDCAFFLEYWSDDDDWDYSNPMLGYESDSDDYGYMDDIPDVMEKRFKFAFKDAGEKRFKNAIKFKDADEKRFKNAFKFKDAGEKRFKNAFKFKGA